MNWKSLLIMIVACMGSAFAGALLGVNRGALPPALGGETPAPATQVWANEIVERVTELEQQNAELRETVGSAQERMSEIETVFVASGLDLEAAAEDIQQVRASLAETDTRLARVDTEFSSTREQWEEFQEEQQKEQEQEEQQLKLEDFVFIDPNPINGVAGPHIIFQGVNVHIESGTGATDDFGQLTGLGNLIIGYNEPGTALRFGSHNLIVGPGHSYESYGGLVAGEANIVRAPSATVSGGTNNLAAGHASIICGGDTNTISDLGEHASIVGGDNNQVTGAFATAVGGRDNAAGGAYANVIGGSENRASGLLSLIAGGAQNECSHIQTGIFAGVNRFSIEGNALFGLQPFPQ